LIIFSSELILGLNVVAVVILDSTLSPFTKVVAESLILHLFTIDEESLILFTLSGKGG
jgi:hypothetical protein